MYSFSSFPALCYYAEHGYTDQDEVNIPLLKRNFGMWACGDMQSAV